MVFMVPVALFRLQCTISAPNRLKTKLTAAATGASA